MTDTIVMVDWQAREISRFADGTYKPVPVKLDYPASHHVHLSVTDTCFDFVAYTPSAEYGGADRQVRLKFGRYLKKTFPDMADADIQTHVSELKSAVSVVNQTVALHFATDKETINRIFETEMSANGSNVASCMYGKFSDQTIRPYHVYADSPDVAVAYVTVDSQIVSRSVVSTKNREWVRCYSTPNRDSDADCQTLKSLLEGAGYSKGNLCGNRLTKLETDEVMLPYIDPGGCYVRDAGKWWIVTESDDGADYRADCTDGTASECGSRCSVCDELLDNCECSYCECCDERYPNGCNICTTCERCDGCVTHDGCGCSRCSECHELIGDYRHYTTCECERCADCGDLVNDCECEPDEDEDSLPIPESEVAA